MRVTAHNPQVKFKRILIPLWLSGKCGCSLDDESSLSVRSSANTEVVVKQTRKNISAGKSPWYGSRAYENGNGDLISILTFGDDEGLGSRIA